MTRKSIFLASLIFICFLVSCIRSNRPHSIKSLTPEPARPHVIEPSTQIQKTIFVDERFSDEIRLIILNAADDWAIVSNRLIEYNLEFDYHVSLAEVSHKIVMVYLDPNDDITQELDKRIEGHFTIGYLKKGDSEFIFMCPARIEKDSYLKIMIEQQLGREMGLNDLPDALPAVMNTIPPDNIHCPTLYDMISFCHLFSCEVEQMNYCKDK